MPNEMAIRLSDGPAEKLVRIHTENSNWDEPEVRYLRRQQSRRERPLPLRLHNPEGTEDIVLAFGQIHVRIYADEDHVRIALSEVPTPPRAA